VEVSSSNYFLVEDRADEIVDELPLRPTGARPVSISKRPATLWCASGGVPAASTAGRARATGGSETSGGAVAVLRRYRNLPYAKSTVIAPASGHVRVSTPIRGGAR